MKCVYVYACLIQYYTNESMFVCIKRVCTASPNPQNTLGLFRQHHKQLYFQLKFNSVPANLYERVCGGWPSMVWGDDGV